MIGLKRGAVRLCPHEKQWEILAAETIDTLKTLLGGVCVAAEHVGSTSIRHICAKPILDIALAVDSFDAVKERIPLLKQHGFYYRGDRVANQLLLACGSYYDGSGDVQTHFIHVVLKDSEDWWDYIRFRDYMNAHPGDAARYEMLKKQLAAAQPNNREAYINGKSAFIKRMLARALAWSYLGTCLTVTVDRPKGYVHKGSIYPIPYGFLPGVLGGDGEELDAYLLGFSPEPAMNDTVTGTVIAVVYRADDVEDKLVLAPTDMSFTEEEIRHAVAFREQYYHTSLEILSREENKELPS